MLKITTKIMNGFGVSALSVAVAMSEFKGAVEKTKDDTKGKKIRKHNYPHWHKQHRESK